MDTVDLISVAASTLRLGTPLILAALAGLFSERAGVIDIGLEGKLLGAAFAAAAIASVTGSPWAALAGAMLTSIALALLHGYAAITLNGNQVVSGMALNILISGLTPTLATAWFNQGGQTPPLVESQRFGAVALPFADDLAGVPVFGPIYSGLLSGQNLLVYLAFLVVPAAAWLLFATRFGLRLRAVGENPHAVDAAGLSVAGLRYRAIIITGALAGIGGAYLSIAQGAGFARDMTAGRGYLALAALIFGRWRPAPTLLACLLFAFADAAQLRLQGVSLPVLGVIPVQFVQALPYILTVILLAGVGGTARAPKAIGIPFVKSR
ncbi:MAG TPA: ABC transporter permease [Stellaceae bacterium]|nr:ABC transporter permease [Stellaceae bacterium]